MSIRRQIQYLRSDKSNTLSALLIKGVTELSGHGFDHFPNDILSIPATDVGFGATGDATFYVDGLDMSIIGIPEFYSVVVDLLTEPYLSSLVNGYCNDNTGAVVTPYSTRVCCTEFVDIPEGSSRFKVDTTISGTAGRAYEYFYDENGAYLKSVTSGTDPLTGDKYWTHQASGAVREVPSSGKKMRVLCRTSGGGDISPSDVGLFKVMFW